MECIHITMTEIFLFFFVMPRIPSQQRLSQISSEDLQPIRNGCTGWASLTKRKAGQYLMKAKRPYGYKCSFSADGCRLCTVLKNRCMKTPDKTLTRYGG